MSLRIGLLVLLFCALAAAAKAQESLTSVSVQQTAADGELMHAIWYRAAAEEEPAPGILLLHMLNGQAQDWLPLAEDLARAGFHALAIDLRGHGKSGGSRDWQQAHRDVTQWWHWFAAQPELDEGAMVVMGASIGGNLALLGCAEWDSCLAAFALSPGRDYRGLQPGPAVVEGDSAPMHLLAARGDEYSAASILHFAEISKSEMRLWLLPGSAHGTQLFATPQGEHILSTLRFELTELLAERTPFREQSD